MPATNTATKTLSALDRFIYLPHAPYVVEQMKGRPVATSTGPKARHHANPQIETADRKRRNAQAKVARDARDARAKDALATLREENAVTLAALPHPRAAETSPGSASNLYFSGMSALDWLDFMLKACGATGRAKLLKEARALLAGR